jgi:polyribonucleotide nucleotidyltransferase
MVESQGSEVSNELMVRAFEYAHAIVKSLCTAQIDFVEEYKQIHALPTTTLTVGTIDEDTQRMVQSIISEEDVRLVYGLGKLEFHDAMHDLIDEVAEKLGYDKESNTPKMGDIADSVK